MNIHATRVHGNLMFYLELNLYVTIETVASYPDNYHSLSEHLSAMDIYMTTQRWLCKLLHLYTGCVLKIIAQARDEKFGGTK